MNRRFLPVCATVAAIVAAIVCGAQAAEAQTPPDPIAAAEKSVVRVVAISLDMNGEVAAVSLGSGFVIAPGEIVTDHHVVAGGAGAAQVKVYIIPERDGGGRPMPAQILRDWPPADLALLSAGSLSATPLTVTLAIPAKDAAVHALGYPGVTDQMRNLPVEEVLSPAEPYVTSGTVALVSRTAPGGANFETIFHTAPINEGNSGGPLIDECGRVIGVNASVGGALAANGEFAIAPGQSAAISGSVLAAFLGPLGVQFNTAPCAAPINASIAARLAADEAAIATEARARADAEARLADAASRRRQLLIAVGIATVAIAALTAGLTLLFRRPRSTAANKSGEATPKFARTVSLGVFLAAIAATILATAAVTALVLGARLSPPPPPPPPPPATVANPPASALPATPAAPAA